MSTGSVTVTNAIRTGTRKKNALKIRQLQAWRRAGAYNSILMTIMANLAERNSLEHRENFTKLFIKRSLHYI